MASTELWARPASGGGGHRTHPLIEAAGAGTLPGWARLSQDRLAHAGRVAGLLDRWALALGLPGGDRLRWRAAGWLHDALRDAPPEEIRPLVPAPLRDLAPSLLHGPAAAARLEGEGVEDRALTAAVAFHTVGHASLDLLGRALYLADFLEPGRGFEPRRRAALAARLPEELDAVLVEVAAVRIADLLRRRSPIHPETQAFWNSLTAGS